MAGLDQQQLINKMCKFNSLNSNNMGNSNNNSNNNIMDNSNNNSNNNIMDNTNNNNVVNENESKLRI